MIWQEKADGYFFPRENLSAAVRSKLQMLSLEDSAQISEGGALIPFEKSVGLSEEDAELLTLPPHNPYQLSVRTEGYIGAKNFKYVIELLNADGRPVVKPQINGAIIHVGTENLFRLNADQFALVNLVALGNKNISSEEPLLTVQKIQAQSATASAKTDQYISEKKIIVPDKLSVDFKESGDAVEVQPILLENRGGELKPIACADFLETFSKRKKVLSTYRGKDGAQYVFGATLRDGLAQIKNVGTISKADARRYILQPKELFTGEAFDFNYSDRVIGFEEMLKRFTSTGGNSGIDWGKGRSSGKIPPAPEDRKERDKTFVLKIKQNIDDNIYAKGSADRTGIFFGEVLNDGTKLFEHQIQGVWKISQVWQKGWHGILIADDMGLGKTLQTLTFIGGLKKFCEINSPILIVAPTALLANWQAEYKRFLRGSIFSEVIPLHGGELRKFFTDERTPNGRKKLSLRNLPKSSIALTTYETLFDYQFSFAEISWNVIIADEAQKIKNPNAGMTIALKAMKYDFAICLSGTPVENSWIDLWSIMDFVQPSHLDELKTFKAKYIDGETGENIQQRGEELRKNLEPLILRRMKEDYLHDLPIKNIYLCREEMPPYQREIYYAVLEKYRRGGFKTPLNFINKLREVSLHPDLGTMAEEKFFELDAEKIIRRSARLIKTFELLKEIKTRGEKVLLFVTSLKMQMILQRLLEKIFAIKILPPINGKIDGAARQRIINEFKTLSGFNALILSPEAAGVGFTITEANNVIHLGRTWNPAKENQATDRVYRIGQKKAVNVYVPLACDKNLRGKTFDENLETLLSYKRNLSANVLFPTVETDADIKTLIAVMNLPDEILSARHWTIEDVDAVTGLKFEEIISDLYNGMGDFTAIKTPATNDFGADVVANSSTSNTGLLIQCKHTENFSGAIGSEGVRQISAAIAYYENKYNGRKFQPVVVTNAENFTSGAIKLAKDNGVRLITRRELENLLRNYKVPKC